MIQVYSVAHDKVIESLVIVGETDYQSALEHLYPRIGEFQVQRKIRERKAHQSTVLSRHSWGSEQLFLAKSKGVRNRSLRSSISFAEAIVIRLSNDLRSSDG